jgi:RNA polymerase sigma-B factor
MLATTQRPAGRSPIDAVDGGLFRALAAASPVERERIYALLVTRHSGLVGWIAACYAGRGVEIDELRQVGYVGLMLSIRRFDPDRGIDFALFATPTVRGELQRHFRDRRRFIQLPRRLQEVKATLRVAGEQLAQTLGRWPNVAELAAFLVVEEVLVREALAADDTFTLPSIDGPVTGGGGLSLADLIGGPDPGIELAVDTQVLRALLAALPARDREILQLRFASERTQSQIGVQLGISQMQVSRLLKSTLGRLRDQMNTVA